MNAVAASDMTVDSTKKAAAFPAATFLATLSTTAASSRTNPGAPMPLPAKPIPIAPTTAPVGSSVSGLPCDGLPLGDLNVQAADFSVQAVERLIRQAIAEGASDLHFVPTPDGLAIAFRKEGVLEHRGVLPVVIMPSIVNRLKVLAQLLTYRTDIPQEGRLRLPDFPGELRASTFPTIHGEKAVIRLFIGSGKYLSLDDIGYSPHVRRSLEHALRQTSGMLLLTGPAGSGKTTSAYACLRWLQAERQSQASLVTLEDPVEAMLPGVSQTQVRRGGEFNYALGLRSLLRQDPDVILVGEIRDAETAQTAFQAALAGHLVISTFHAGSASDALCRLTDLGVEPFLLRSALLAISCQRLVRRLAPAESTPVEEPLPVAKRYRGRFVAAEVMEPELHCLSRAIMCRAGARRLEAQAGKHGFVKLRTALEDAVHQGATDWPEVYRVLGTEQPPEIS